MTKFLEAIIALKEFAKLVHSWIEQAKAYFHSENVNNNIKKLKEGHETNDTRKIEEAIGSTTVGEPSGIDGVRRRNKKQSTSSGVED